MATRKRNLSREAGYKREKTKAAQERERARKKASSLADPKSMRVVHELADRTVEFRLENSGLQYLLFEILREQARNPVLPQNLITSIMKQLHIPAKDWPTLVKVHADTDYYKWKDHYVEPRMMNI